MALFLTNNLR